VRGRSCWDPGLGQAGRKLNGGPAKINPVRGRDLQRETDSLLAGTEYATDSGAVLGLVRDNGCSAYDCDFIALAIKLNPTLVTMDKKRLQALSERAVALNSG